jgi:hypothetical protein
MLKGGSTVGDTKGPVVLSGSDASFDLGGGSDLWGASLSVNDVNDSGFGILAGCGVAFLSGSSVNIKIDLIQLKVHYSLVRGSWLLQDGVRRRWVDAGLDDILRAAWGANQTRSDVLPYNVGEARAASDAHPRPYCVVDYGTPTSKGNSTGRNGATDISYYDVPVQFRIYGTTKAQAQEYARLVASAYVAKYLTLQQDRHLITLVDPDFYVREGDRTHVWVLQYRFRIEGEYPRQYT